MDLGQCRRVHLISMREDLLQNLAHLEVVRVSLVVEDVAAGERCLIQMPDEHLLPKWKRLEAIGIQLDDGRVVDTLEQILTIPGRSGGGHLAGAAPGAGAPGPTGQAHRHRYDHHERLTQIHVALLPHSFGIGLDGPMILLSSRL